MRGKVVAMIGEPAVSGADLQASGVVGVKDGRWTLELELQGAGGGDRRTLVDGECRALADAAALVIAVAIDPQARAPVPEDSPAEAVVPAPPDVQEARGPEPAVPEGRGAPAPVPEDRVVAAPVPEDRPVGEAPVERRRAVRLGLRVAGGVGFARILPAPHAMLELALGVEGRGWRAEIGGGFAPPVHGTAATNPGIGGEFRLGLGEVRGCGMPGLARVPVEFPLCLGLQVGAMHGRGEGPGLAVTYDVRALWVATRAGAAVRWRPRGGRFGLWLGLDAVVRLTRPAFVTAGEVQVHAAAPVGGQASLGLEVLLR
jgi:hypothetical protein